MSEKTIYSDEVIDIVNKAKIERLLKKCHRIRKESGLMQLSDDGLLVYALKMYKRRRERILQNRKKKEAKNG